MNNERHTDQAREHELKTDPEVFEAVWSGSKTHEIRKDDRDFQVGDALYLRETEFTGLQMHMGKPLVYTGREVRRTVSHVLTGYGLQDGWCILSFAPLAAAPAEPVKPIGRIMSESEMGIGFDRKAGNVPQEPDYFTQSIIDDLQNEFGLSYSILSKATLGSMLVDALRLHVGVVSAREPAQAEPASPVQLPPPQDLGASPSATACSVASLPEPKVSGLRLPPAGAEVAPSQLYEAIAAEFSDDGLPWSRVKGELRRAYKTYASIINCWNRHLARGMEARQGKDPQGLDGEATTARPAGTRPGAVGVEAGAVQPSAAEPEGSILDSLDWERLMSGNARALDPTHQPVFDRFAAQPVQPSGAGELRAAAQALVECWDTPLWKDVPHTAVFINRLRAALSKAASEGAKP